MGSEHRLLEQLEKLHVDSVNAQRLAVYIETLTSAGDAFADALWPWLELGTGPKAYPPELTRLAAVETLDNLDEVYREIHAVIVCIRSVLAEHAG